VLRPPAAGPANFTVPLKKTGMYYFADPVTTIEQRNCDAGMQITVSVGGVCRRPPQSPGEHDMQDHAPTDVHDAWETALCLPVGIRSTGPRNFFSNAAEESERLRPSDCSAAQKADCGGIGGRISSGVASGRQRKHADSSAYRPGSRPQRLSGAAGTDRRKHHRCSDADLE